jgi:ABC-type transport system involved in cytochrome c biogenesis ATPase subunit
VPALLWADGVTVARGRTTLLESYSLQLAAGELVHLRGANGSGKSSLMRVLAGVVEPRRGRVVREARCRYVPERVGLPESLPARRWLRVCRADHVELAPELDRRCGALSNGQLQRVVLTTLLENRSTSAATYLLDEPWAGLDAGARESLDARLRGLVQNGSAVLYTDHGHETALTPTRTVDLTEGGFSPSVAVRIELRRGDERAHVMVSDAELAARLADGWEIDRGGTPS